VRLKGRRRGRRSRERKPPPASFSSKFFSRDSHSRPPFRGLKFSGSSRLGEARDISARQRATKEKSESRERQTRKMQELVFLSIWNVAADIVQNKNVSFFALSLRPSFPTLAPSAGPTGGAGLALPAGRASLM
jgi:hypothetical protein